MGAVKKYDLNEITIRLENLKNKFGSYVVENEIKFYRKYTDNECDVLNLTYRALKHKFTKIQRFRFGIVRVIDYEIRQRKKLWTLSDKIVDNSIYGYGFFNTSSTFTITTSNNYVW
jgi:hypothetical protein